jgi:hypothetical protein
LLKKISIRSEYVIPRPYLLASFKADRSIQNQKLQAAQLNVMGRLRCQPVSAGFLRGCDAAFRKFGEISNSHGGEYDDGCLLSYCAV